MPPAIQRLITRLEQTLPGQVLLQYSRANAGLYAVVIAYTTIFALFPIVLALLTLTGLFLHSELAFNYVANALARLLPGDAAAGIVDVLQGTREQTGLLGILSFLGLLWGGSALFGTIADAFNHIYGLPNRPLLQQRLMAVLMILLFALLLLLSFVGSAVAALLIQFTYLLPFGDLPGFTILAPALSYLISFASALLLFWAIYYIVPNVRLTVGESLPGAILCAVLFLLLMQAFPLYVRFFTGFQRYGAVFGFLFLLLTWFYFLAQVLLLGAALNAVRHPHPDPRVKS